MTGIAGFFGDTNNHDKNKLVKDMADSLKFKLRDEIDFWENDNIALARVHHNFINFEKQPIVNSQKNLYIIMDGEIFDCQEIKNKLIQLGYQFQYKDNDAELCLNIYQEYGEEGFKNLNGAFIICIYDKNNKELIIVNDRFAAYNIFYTKSESGQFIFCTLLNPILNIPGIKKEINPLSVFEFFSFQRILSTDTFLNNIKILEPATILKFKNKKIELKKYYNPHYSIEKFREKDLIEKVAQAFINSIDIRTKENYKYGILLSGGLDARTFLGACQKDIIAFTASDNENREVKTARKIANAKGCRHIFLKRKQSHYADIFDIANELGSGHYRYNHAHYIGLYDEIEQEVNVLLHGFGVDTFFKKLFYLPHREFKLFNKVLFSYAKRLNNKKIALEDVLLSQTTLNIIGIDIFKEEYKNKLSSALFDNLSELFKRATEYGAEDEYRKLDYFIYHSAFNMSGYLHMSHIRSFLNERAPLFDNNVYELHLAIPPKLRLSADIIKGALRLIAPKLAMIPSANTSSLPIMPKMIENMFLIGQKVKDNLKTRKSIDIYKQTSWPNYNELFRSNPQFNKLLDSILENDSCFDSELFDFNKIKDIIEKHQRRERNYEDIILLLLTFGRWHSKYVA